MAAMSALDLQEGGDHYRTFAIQPVEFVMRNRWDFCAGCILKYLVRYRRKGGLSDLRKARHFVELRAAISAEPIEWMPAILMRAFIAANRIPVPHDARALLALEDLVHGRAGDAHGDLLARIDDLIARQQGQ
jgi:hypothetical protein